MRKQVDAKYFVEMSSALENDELGAAIRMLSRIISTERPIPSARVHIVAQMSKKEWESSSTSILDLFEVCGDEVSHAALRESLTPSVSAVTKGRVGQTQSLPIVSPARKVVVPNYPSRDAPDHISIKQAAYVTMVRMCKAANQSENTARAVLASLLKSWPEGDVYQAVYQADRQGFLVDPKKWIIASLKQNSTPTVRQTYQRGPAVPAPMKKHIMTSPESVGVSSSTAEKIRSRNRSLTLNLTAIKETNT